MKSLLGKIGTLALVGMAGVAIAACSSSIEKKTPGEGSVAQNERVGNVSLALQPVSGITVANVNYVVTAGDPAAVPAPAIVSQGTLPTPGTSDDFSFGIPLPVGAGYYISLTGESAEPGDDITCTGAYGAFAVTANTSTAFNMVLTCVDNTSGQIIATVDVETDACPRLIVDYAVAEPASALVGGEIKVYAAAHDLDNAAAAITYAWSIVDPTKAGVGDFTPANIDDTTFNCNGAGDSVVIKVTADNGQCQKSLETAVSCVNEACGNGAVDVGETCDPNAGPDHPADPTCPADCTKVCGDGIPELGETCDPLPLDPANCFPPGGANACTPRPIVCGDGFVSTGEECDTNGALPDVGPGGAPLPAGSSCDSVTCKIQGPKCGDGLQGGIEECDNGTGSNAVPVQAPSRTCSAQCEEVSTTACVACEQAGDCFESSDNCMNPAFSFAQTTLCHDIMQCIQDTNCLDGNASLGRCYCGPNLPDTNACNAGSFTIGAANGPNGLCASLMQQGNPAATTNIAILSGLIAKGIPTGAAGQRLNCQKTSDAGACATTCGVN